MVRRRQHERSLFEVLLPDGHKLWPDWLRRIDTLLEDDAVLDVVTNALEARWPESRRRGRPGTPAEVVLRMLILKHLFDWSYDELEHEVRANLVHRAFTRIDAGAVPDAKTILKIAHVLGPDVVAQVHRQVVAIAQRAGVTHGRRFRVDTTVVDTNVHPRWLTVPSAPSAGCGHLAAEAAVLQCFKSAEDPTTRSPGDRCRGRELSQPPGE